MLILIEILRVIFAIVALLMILIILMQRPKSEGLGAAFGGGVTENIFGAQTTNVLTKITGWLAGIFFILTFVISMLYAHLTNTSSGVRQEVEKQAATTTTVPAPVSAANPAVGAPNTVTNPTPGTGEPAATSAKPPTAADQAVGVTAPTQLPVPTASAKPSP